MTSVDGAGDGALRPGQAVGAGSSGTRSTVVDEEADRGTVPDRQLRGQGAVAARRAWRRATACSPARRRTATPRCSMVDRANAVRNWTLDVTDDPRRRRRRPARTAGPLLETGAKFCEACGKAGRRGGRGGSPRPAGEPSPLDDLSPISARHGTPGHGGRRAPPPAPRAPCLQCGGAVDDDGYCTQCGTKAPSQRDHFEEQPAPWVAGVCDRGIRHHRNEDAMALRRSTGRARRPGRLRRRLQHRRLRHRRRWPRRTRRSTCCGRRCPAGMGVPREPDAAVTQVFTDAAAAGQRRPSRPP